MNILPHACVSGFWWFSAKVNFTKKTPIINFHVVYISEKPFIIQSGTNPFFGSFCEFVSHVLFSQSLGFFSRLNIQMCAVHKLNDFRVWVNVFCVLNSSLEFGVLFYVVAFKIQHFTWKMTIQQHVCVWATPSSSSSSTSPTKKSHQN